MIKFTKGFCVLTALTIFEISASQAFAALPSWAAQLERPPAMQQVQTPAVNSATASLTAMPLSSPPPNWPWRGIVISGGTTSDLAKMSAKGVNAVALPLAVRSIAQNDHLSVDAAWAKELAWADKMLDECKKDKMVGIITLVGFPLNPSLGLYQESPQFWNNPQLLHDVVTRVGMLAQHFASRGVELGAYDILNEPLDRSVSGGVPTQWQALRVNIVKEIRKYDQNHYVVVTPGPGGMAAGYAKFVPLNYPGIIYSAHIYGPMSYSHQGLYGLPLGEGYPSSSLSKQIMERNIQPLVNFQKKYNAYVYIGEFSAVNWAPGSIQFLTDLISLFDADKFSWAYYGESWYGWHPSYDDRYIPINANAATAVRHYVGDNTPRWQLLNQEFAKNPKR